MYFVYYFTSLPLSLIQMNIQVNQQILPHIAISSQPEAQNNLIIQYFFIQLKSSIFLYFPIFLIIFLSSLIFFQIMSEELEQKQNKQHPSPSQQFNLKSIQPEEELKPKSRPRPSVDPQDKDKIKKKRKLLSFDDEIQEPQPDLKQKIKRPLNSLQSKDQSKHGKGNLQQQLKQQYQTKIEKLKQQLFQVDYSYWDGPQVIKKLKRKKKQKIQSLVEVCRLELIGNFQSLASCSADDLLMVVKDFIIPHKMTIADIEALQLKTSKGDLLLCFKNVKIKDMILSVKANDGPIRIIERSRYQKNVTSYPFNTWRTINVD